MATSRAYNLPTDLLLATVLLDDDGNAFDVVSSEWDVKAGDDWADYSIATPEDAQQPGTYSATIPTEAMDRNFTALMQSRDAGDDPAATDAIRASGYFDYDAQVDLAIAKTAAEAVDTLTKIGGDGDLAVMKVALDAVSLGTGARTVTITVDDGTDTLETARVRVTNGAETYVGNTNASGVIAFGLDDATWTVVITKSQYTFTATTLVVDGNKARTYSMTAKSIPASDPDFVTGYLYCYDEEGTVEEDVVIYLRLVSGPDDGVSYDTIDREGTSDEAGLVSFTNISPGGSYAIKRGRFGEWTDFDIAAAATSPYALPMVAGKD